MDNKKKLEIEQLAKEAHEKRLKFEMLGMLNQPVDNKEREQAAINYALSQRELIEANSKLQNAILL